MAIQQQRKHFKKSQRGKSHPPYLKVWEINQVLKSFWNAIWISGTLFQRGDTTTEKAYASWVPKDDAL